MIMGAFPDIDMEHCSINSDNQTVCIVHDDCGSGFSSFMRDMKLVVNTFLFTFLVVMAYNYYLHVQVQGLKQKRRKSIDDDPSADEMENRTESKHLVTVASSSMQSSIAASLAEIDGMHATGNFLSAVFGQMWDQLNVAVSNSIKDTLEPTLRDMKVPLHFIKLDLGDVPIKTTNMFIHRVGLEGADIDNKKETKPGIQIDVDVVWDGTCDIMLQATFTRSVKMTFGVKQIKLSGRMHIILSPLTTEMPVVSAVQYGFTNPPTIQLSFTGAVQSVTSKLGFVQNALVSVIHSSLASMLCLPNRMVMPMDLGSYDYLDTYQPPVGMVRLAAVNGRGFTLLKKMIFNDIPDVYCVMRLGASNTFRPPFRTTTKYDNLTPDWSDEFCDFILYDMDQKVYVEVFDENKTALDPDDELGTAEITARDLFRNDGKCELELEQAGEKTGCYVTVSAELFYLSEQLQSFSSLMYEGKNQLCGLATIIITKAFDIPIPKVDAATFIKVVYGEGSKHKKTFYTGTVMDYPGIDPLNPMFDCVFHIPITAEMLGGDRLSSISSPSNGNGNGLGISLPSSLRTRLDSSNRKKSQNGDRKSANTKKHDFVFTLVDTDGANGTPGHGELGKMTVTHEELMRAYKHTITETRPIGDNGAKLEFRIALSGMQSEEEKLQSSASRKDSPQDTVNQPSSLYKSLYSGLENGVSIRVTAVRGRGFRIRERRIGKKNDVPDVYCTIRLNPEGAQQELTKSCLKTSTIKDDTMPIWNESKDFDNIDPPRDLIRVDVYDENRGWKDDYLGSAEVSCEKLLRKRTMEIELCNGTTRTKSYVTLMGVHLSSSENKTSEAGEDVVVHCHPELGDEGVESTLINGRKASIVDEDEEDEDDGDIVAPLISVSAPPTTHPFHKSGFSDDESLGSLGSTSSSSSMFRKMRKVKRFPGKLGKKFSHQSSKKKKKDEE